MQVDATLLEPAGDTGVGDVLDANLSSGGWALANPRLDKLFAHGRDVHVGETDFGCFNKIAKEVEQVSSSIRQGKTECQDKRTKMIEHVVATGTFQMRDFVGQAWARAIKKNPTMASEYSSLGGRDAKQQYRAEWARKTYSTYAHGKKYEKDFSSVNVNLGQYHTFGGLVKKYGGWQWPAAVQGAKRTALRCAALGGDWVDADDEFSGLMHFLVMDKQHKHIFAEKWSMWESFMDYGDTVAVSAPASASDGAEQSVAIKATTAPSPPASSSADARDTTNSGKRVHVTGAADVEPTPNKRKKESDVAKLSDHDLQLLKEVQKVRASLTKAISIHLSS